MNDEAAIAELHRTWTAAIERQDIGTLLNLIAEDAVFWPDQAGALSGHDNIRWLYEQTFARYEIIQSYTSEQIVISGDLAVDCGEEAFEARPVDGNGGPTMDRRRTLMVLRRGGDGRWRYIRGMSNRAAPAQKPSGNAS